MLSEMVLHPFCLAIPEMTESEYQELKEDISGSGLLEPIVVFEGMILDGRHRYKACTELGIEPWFKQFEGPDSAMDYVVSKNLRRRNLTDSQKAMVWQKLCGLQRGGNAGVTKEVIQGNGAIAPLIKTQTQAALQNLQAVGYGVAFYHPHS